MVSGEAITPGADSKVTVNDSTSSRMPSPVIEIFAHVLRVSGKLAGEVVKLNSLSTSVKSSPSEDTKR